MQKKILIIISLLVVLIPINVKAATGNIKITCDKEKIKAGDSTTCIISGITDSEIIGISATLNLTDNLTFTSFTKNNSWSEGSIENNKLDIYSENYLNNNFDIGTMVITAKDNISNTNEKMTLKDITFQNDKSNNAEENSFKVSDAITDIRIPSNVNTLSSLTISGISFDFSEDNTNYQLETTETSVTISATAKDSKATVTGDIGTKNLNYGGNNFSIKVTSESGDVKTYTINITRPDNRSKENYLTSFAFSNYNIDFTKDKTDYNITLENKISKLGICKNEDNTLCISLDSIKVSDKSTYIVKFNDKIIDTKNTNSNVGGINVGNNILSITVVAENDGERVYTFNISRKNEEGKTIDSDKTDDGINTNVKTGDSYIISIILVLVLSICTIIYLYKKNIIKRKNKSNE
ncbi:MAG: cadherin-like beta sandwich domain-containing protein [Bacilli bacterium]|nr:cadherin-like beta sandwich domain-containing protein [Clostridium sp.]MDY2804830.1 cadherin-like beta sandwich domain-containing protein [Bacilli bacterium]